MSVALEPPVRTGAVSIEATELSHRYAPGRGLDPISFAIRSPGVVVVTGANGSGKSTLLKIVAGLLRPSGGKVALSIDGASIGAAERRRHVGYAGPDLTFYHELTVAENLTFAGEARGLDAVRETVRGALESVRLERRAGDRADSLSSGMVQRLRIAFAMLHDPAVLLLDEPGSHLDEEGRALVARVVERRRGERLVIIATNDETEVKLGDQRIRLHGRGLGDPS